MATKGDIKRARCVKAEFDDTMLVSSRAGAAVFERAFRSLGLRSMLEKHLPKRSGEYSSADVAEQVIAGLLCGGRGFQATTLLRQDAVLARLFGYVSVAEEATVYRAMCDLAGLPYRSLEQVYTPVLQGGPSRLDIFGREKTPPTRRRTVPEMPEAMQQANRAQFDTLLATSAQRSARAMPAANFQLFGMTPVFIDGSALEVSGRCFDAARKDRKGNLSLQLMTLYVGPVLASARVFEGAHDEGRAMPEMVALGADVVKAVAGKRPVLALVDSAGAEEPVISALEERGWKYLIGANQWRHTLEKIAAEQPEMVWKSQGADPQRVWRESQTAAFSYKPEKCAKPLTVVARRYRNEGELDGMPWRYSFLYTNLEAAADLPKKQVKKNGFASLCWMLYSTKQGYENNFKTLLCDLGGHHPPSGRLGATEVFVFLAGVAANVWTVLSYKAAPVRERGMRLWRFVRDYVVMAGTVTMQAGRTLLVRLCGGGVDVGLKRNWLDWFGGAGRL